jgi:hypothetical protein
MSAPWIKSEGDQIVKTFERALYILILLCIATGSLQAQGIDTTGNGTNASATVPSTKSFLIAGGKDTLWLSNVPSLFELTKIVAAPRQGGLDPFVALQAVISKGDGGVGALDSLLFSDPIAKIITTRLNPATGAAGGEGREMVISDTVRPNKLYAVMALEAIGSKTSYPVLVHLAQAHPNKDVRGIALNALANTYHEGERLQRFVPDKELVHLLLSNVDDTTSVPYLVKSFGQIAREGLITWLGEDFGEPVGKNRNLRDVKGAVSGTTAEYREIWWRQNTSRLSWDGEMRRFLIK